MKRIFKFLIVMSLPAMIFAQIHFSLPDTLYPSIDETITIPISVDEIVAADEVKNYKIVLGYDETVLSYTKGDYSRTGTLSSDLFVVDNVNTENQITFAAAGSEIMTGSGILLNFNLTVLDAGISEITIKEIDLSSSPATFTTSGSVIIVNTPPVFEQALPDTTILENETLNFNYEGFDGDDNDLIFSMISEIEGATLTEEGAFSWTPNYDQEGEYELIVSLTDGFATINDTAIVTVENSNQLPEFNAVPADTTIFENEEYSFQYAASDNDEDVLSFLQISEVEGVSVISDGLLTWTPNYEQAGSYEIIVGVTDGIDTVNDTVLITVENVNRTPLFIVAMPDTTVLKDSIFSFQYDVEDLDGDSIELSLESSPEGMTLSAEGLLDWTPATVGEYTTIVSATDGDFIIYDTTKINVVVPNQPPVFTTVLADTTIEENQNFSFLYGVSDPDDDDLEFSLVNVIDGMTIDNSGTLQWTPSYTQAGEYDVIVMVSDGYLNAKDTAHIVVTDVNRAPGSFSLIAPENETSITINLNADSDSLIFTWSEAVDPDGDAVTYSLFFFTESDTLLAETNLTEREIKYSYSILYSLFGTYNVEQITGSWQVVASDGATVTLSDAANQLTLIKGSVGIDDNNPVVTKFNLAQNYPNPFNPTTTISYSLPKQSHVKLSIYNMLGKEVSNLVNAVQTEGIHKIQWNAVDMPSGSYFMTIKATSVGNGAHYSNTKKMLLLK